LAFFAYPQLEKLRGTPDIPRGPGFRETRKWAVWSWDGTEANIQMRIICLLPDQLLLTGTTFKQHCVPSMHY